MYTILTNKQTNRQTNSVISGPRREVAENCTLLGYYAASSGNFLNPEDGTDRLSRNVRKELSPYAAQYPREVQIWNKQTDCIKQGSFTEANSFWFSQEIPCMILSVSLSLPGQLNPVDAHVSNSF